MTRCLRQQGMTLVEVLVSITIGAILLAGILNIVHNNKQTFNAQQSLTRLKENGRYARYVMQRDIRMAGFQGCNNTRVKAPVNQLDTPTSAQTFTNQNMLMGYQATGTTWSPTIPDWITDHLPSGTSIVNGTDVLTIRKMENNNAYLTSAMANASAPIITAGNTTFKDGDLLYITDCEGIDIFTASSGTSNTAIQHTGSGNTSTFFSKVYGTDAYVGHLQTYTYYIRTTGRTNQTGQTINVLARQDIRGNEEVLIDGIDNMKITYGIDTNADHVPDNFQTASAVQTANAWKDVVSIRIIQLLNSIDEVGVTNQAFNFQGVQQSANDRLLRRQWDIYISLRNRAL